MAEPNAFKLIESCIKQLDSEMNSHKNNCIDCIDCINTKLCSVWYDMLETWNFYHLAALRMSRNVMLPPNYEQD